MGLRETIAKVISSHPLGDTIGKALSLVGITDERVTGWLGEECGCAERREKLNRLSKWAAKVLQGEEVSSPVPLLPSPSPSPSPSPVLIEPAPETHVTTSTTTSTEMGGEAEAETEAELLERSSKASPEERVRLLRIILRRRKEAREASVIS